ncbi:hypothetical protein HDU76_007829 [Blyttiomyces sp. JEL0837]|nr:hypothetical protein HDU76_007829 [Blyttiomyces sp. JEL0837]
MTNQTFIDAGKDSNVYILGALTAAALFIRLFRISYPPEVVFDEVHFGGFASKYINGAFFMDVHPPLGKLLIAASGVLAGYDGSFSFKDIGLDYLEKKVPYVTMRLLPGILGVLLVPMSYITMRNMGFSNSSSVLTAIMLLLENGFATQSRLILLDSIMLFFIGLAFMMWTDFLSNQEVPFTFTWWYPLFMTGFALGLAASVKWVGLFVIALVGLSTIHNLWIILGDLRVSSVISHFIFQTHEYITNEIAGRQKTFGKHFLARAVCLIFVPFVIYAFLFQVHFWVLPNAGSGSGFMSAEFQSTLKGNEIDDTFADLAMGSKIYLRHAATNGGYLHSHKHNYETGSKQQQITCYPFRDDNGLFLVKPALKTENGTTFAPNVTSLWKLQDGDVIRLEHLDTMKHLHSHDHRPPLTDNEHHNEVSAYGQEGYAGDTNDHWRVEILNKDPKDKTVKAMSSKIKLVHVNTHCALFSHSVKLPDYAFGQQEVTCAKDGRKDLVTWIIEYNDNPFMPANAKKVNYKKPSFFSKFAEIHKVMWNINKGLTGSHPYDSRPGSWPVLRRGISFWTAKGGKSGQIYLIGNPIVWWFSTWSIVIGIVAFIVVVLLQKRQINIISNLYLSQTCHAAALLVLGWALHYFPFFLMKRQLFLHHYFPSLYFAILMAGVLFDLAVHRLKPASQWTIPRALRTSEVG